MVVLQEKGITPPPPGIWPLQALANDVIWKQTIIPIQEINKQHMETWNQK